MGIRLFHSVPRGSIWGSLEWVGLWIELNLLSGERVQVIGEGRDLE